MYKNVKKFDFQIESEFTYQMIIFDRERDRYAFRGDHSKSPPNQVDSGYNVQVLYYCLVDLLANWKRLYCYQLNRPRCLLQLHLYRRAIYWEDPMIAHNRTNAYLLGRHQEEEVRNHPLYILQRLQPMLTYQRFWNSTNFHQSFEDPNQHHNLNEKLRIRLDKHGEVTPETKKIPCRRHLKYKKLTAFRWQFRCCWWRWSCLWRRSCLWRWKCCSLIFS